MIFKQKVLKEEKIKFILFLTCVAVSYVANLVIILINMDDIKLFILFSIIFYFPILLLTIVIGSFYLEWYYIYYDHIEVRNVYGIKNTVYFCNVSYVEKININLTTRGMKKTFYIFNDGRKNNNNMFDINSCYNNKRINLRIYQTNNLDNYILNVLKLKVKDD